MNNITRQPIHEKPKKLTPAEIAAGKIYMGFVKRLPCCICGARPPSDAHHTICDRYGTKRGPGETTIPLCKHHHQWGPDAIHNGKESWVRKYGKDTDYIEETKERVERLKENDMLGEWF